MVDDESDNVVICNHLQMSRTTDHTKLAAGYVESQACAIRVICRIVRVLSFTVISFSTEDASMKKCRPLVCLEQRSNQQLLGKRLTRRPIASFFIAIKNVASGAFSFGAFASYTI